MVYNQYDLIHLHTTYANDSSLIHNLAQTLGVDILPVVIYGTGKALKKRGRLLRKWPVHMEIDRRITPEEMMSMGETTRRQASQMRKYYQKRYTEIADRIEQDV